MAEKFNEKGETDILKSENVISSEAFLKVLDDGSNIRNGYCQIRVPVSSDQISKLIIESQRGIPAIGSGYMERMIEVICADGYIVEMTQYKFVDGDKIIRYLHRSAFSRKIKIDKSSEETSSQEPEKPESNVDKVRYGIRSLMVPV